MPVQEWRCDQFDVGLSVTCDVVRPICPQGPPRTLAMVPLDADTEA